MPSLNEKEHSFQLYKNVDKLVKQGSCVFGKPKNMDDKYSSQWTGFYHADVEKGIGEMLGHLSLFAPITHDSAATTIEQVQLDRPVTPIDEEVTARPQTFDNMAHYVRRRVMAKPNVPFLSMEDQKNLAAIIVSEVNGIWPNIRKQIDDPFLNFQENKELNRRIAVHIITICEKLFHDYLRKAQVLNNRGVFSGPANMSRLKVQLALEASDLLNVLKIRRYIVNDIKTAAVGQNAEGEPSARSTQPTSSSTTLSHKTMLDVSYSRTKHQRIKSNTVEHEIKEIENSMPVLDTHNLMSLFTHLPERNVHSPKKEDLHARPCHISERVSNVSHVSKKDSSRQKTIIKRSNSQPLFDDGGSLLDELDIDQRVRADKLIELELKLLQREREGLLKLQTNRGADIQLSSGDLIENDLKRLTRCEKDESIDGNDEDDMPPLVQAITRHARHDDLKERMEKQLIKLEDKQKMRNENECIYVRDATHPQPDTINAKLGNAGVVRTSDIRVSERVCMSSMTLKRYAAVYNDLLEEIDQDTVKNLDTNLFFSDEINEVYKEIMKTVPTKHLELDDDPQVLNAPDSVNLAHTMASATLSHKVMDRIINPAFRRERLPPWAGSDMKEWARTPVNPPKNIRGEDLLASITPDMAKIHDVMHDFGQMRLTGKLSFAEEKMSQAYTIWLQWWKSNLTSNDYMKYLSAQQTDFLGAVFHFYDSEEDDESENEGSTNKPHHFSRGTHAIIKGKISIEEKERLRKLEELRNVKSDYKKGFWNANAVLMGGLGKDPELAEVKANESRASRSVQPIHQKSLRQSRKAPEKKDHGSRMSKTTTGTSEHVGAATFEAPQDRLESVWQQLQMPDSQRLDMAIKYSCNDYFNKLTEAIERWELAAGLIQKRETLLAKLEKFERQASDPNRFFAKDSKNSIHRFEESKRRNNLCKRVDILDVDIKEEINYLHNKFQDVITYKGRPYIDKMKWDRTEMLYWLSEERKQNGLKYEAMTRGLNLPLRPAHLQPIMP